MDRPVITKAPSGITYGNTFLITLNGTYPLDSMALMKPGAVTHGNNMDQRYIELAFVPDASGPPGRYIVTAPDQFRAPPGYYMLFVLKAKSQSSSGNWKIPSVGKFLKIS